MAAEPAELVATGLAGTRSSHWWQSRPGRMDPLNLRALWPSTNHHGIPDLAPCDFEPEQLAAWHHPAGRAAATGTGALHFFLDDYRFERTWTAPDAAMARVAEVGAALTPDFSLWTGAPLAAQMWQVYRSRWVGAYWQHHGHNVIPTASWGDRTTYDFAFDGLPTGATIAIGTVGVRGTRALELFHDGLAELLARTTPTLLLVYGQLPTTAAGLPLPRVREYPTWWAHRRPPPRPKR